MQGLLALPLAAGCRSFCLCLGRGLRLALAGGRGQPRRGRSPSAGFLRRGRTRLAPHRPFLFQSLWRSRAWEGRPRRRPPAVGPGRAGPGTAGAAPASDRLGWSRGRGRMGVGVQTRVSVPRRGLAERLLNLDF